MGGRERKMKMDMELERFKTEINLAAYAMAQGYEIDRRESSRSSLVMRRGSDEGNAWFI